MEDAKGDGEPSNAFPSEPSPIQQEQDLSQKLYEYRIHNRAWLTYLSTKLRNQLADKEMDVYIIEIQRLILCEKITCHPIVDWTFRMFVLAPLFDRKIYRL